MTNQFTVCMNAYETLANGDETYIDEDRPQEGETGVITGWNVYLRQETPNDPQQPFDLPLERDFTNREEAVAWGNLLAEQYATELRSY